MLAGKKPLSVWYDYKDCFSEVVIRYLRLFDRHVVEGRMARFDHFSDSPAPGSRVLHRISFALPGEEWRVQEMIDLMSSDERWTSVHERRQGELLGYENWMNDYWLENIYSKHVA